MNGIRKICWVGVVYASLGAFAAARGAEKENRDKVANTNDFSEIRRQVETLRGRQFKKDVPVFDISKKELRAISDRDLEKDYPGEKLKRYEELLAWLDMVPPHTDLKTAYGDLFVNTVAGLYDSDSKEMCIPSYNVGVTNAAKKPADKKLENFSPEVDTVVLAHEF